MGTQVDYFNGIIKHVCSRGGGIRVESEAGTAQFDFLSLQ